MTVKPRCIYDWDLEMLVINHDDPYWIGFYDALYHHGLMAHEVFTRLEDRLRWRAGAMDFIRSRREFQCSSP